MVLNPREYDLGLLKLKADLESCYGEKHSKIGNIEDQPQTSRRENTNKLKEAVKAFDKRHHALRDAEAALSKWMQHEKTVAIDIAEMAFKYRPMARDAEDNTKAFGQITQRRKKLEFLSEVERDVD